MANQVPEKMINYRVYGNNGADYLGVVDAELPSIEAMTETISGAGIAGEVDSPTLGHFGSIKLTLKWRTVNKKFIEFAAQQAHDLDLRSANQVYDAGSGTYSEEAVRITCRAVPRNLALGSLVVGKSADSSTEFEVLQMRVYIDGNEVLELDKYNFIYRVNGVDYLKGVRGSLGLN